MQKYTSRNIDNNKNRLSTRIKWGIAITVCSILLLFCIVVNFLPFIRSGILGVFGLSAYPVLIITTLVGILLTRKKKYTIAKNYVLYIL